SNYSLLVQFGGDLRLREPLLNEHRVNLTNTIYLYLGSKREHYSISLKTLPVPATEFALRCSVFINELASEPITSCTSLSKPEFYQSTLTSKDFDRKFSAILSRHYSLNVL